eukprot:3169179-Rhodomonas_salina.2
MAVTSQHTSSTNWSRHSTKRSRHRTKRSRHRTKWSRQSGHVTAHRCGHIRVVWNLGWKERVQSTRDNLHPTLA